MLLPLSHRIRSVSLRKSQQFVDFFGIMRQIFLFGRHSVPCYNLSYKLGFGGNAYGS